ncbi:TIGR02679 family protein [Rhodococcoides kyotonense]|uniref:TIGR02679 family protein n=1 Tax=Rhodococcoides kyotonense TaxID=398843 RepID=A0A239CLH8_9NOCA|nr:TIGR02679 family protein [Rhodococcus kyotonensis]SNS20752.1 TIGR02679 family protein [Rhodococcus kyotonensis]
MPDDGTWRGTAELDALLAAARKKLESNWLNVTGTVTIHLGDPPDLWRLCSAISRSSSGLHSRAHTTRLDLARFDEWLTHPRNGGRGLLATLNEQTPLQDKKQLAADKADVKARALSDARTLLESHGDWADRWLSSLLNQDGTLGGRVAVDSLRTAARVLAVLPVDGLSLTELAESACGDTKALASGGAPRLVLDALSLREGIPRPADPVGIRLLWETAGVSVDALSSRVVVLGYRVAEDHAVARWLNEAAAEGIPFALTLDMIGRGSLTNTAERIFVCENIAVVAAAARTLGSRSATLLCTDGQPSAALHKLLAGLAPGTNLHWRNDFDWPGLQMTSRAISRYDATPWRMDAESYRHALDARNSEPLKGFPTSSAWDPELATAMHESGRAVMEERSIPDLLRDLAPGD